MYYKIELQTLQEGFYNLRETFSTDYSFDKNLFRRSITIHFSLCKSRYSSIERKGTVEDYEKIRKAFFDDVCFSFNIKIDEGILP